MTQTTPAIAAHELKVVRGEKTILRGVSLEVETGEVVGVLGPSGAGKSTLFRALVGELPVASGTITLAGKDVTKQPLWRRAQAGVAYVPQTPSVLWDLTVEENLRVYHRVVHSGTGLRSFWAQRSRLPGEDDAIAKLAARVALEDRMNVRAGELSGGERRRLELARALTRRPKVLVCDEPFAAIDPQQATRLGELLGGLAKDEKDPVAVVLADHHVAEALSVCTRALLLLDGRIAVEAPPEQFREDPLVQGRYLGSWQRSLPPPSLR